MVCRYKAFALLCAVAPPTADCIGVCAGFFCCRLSSLVALCPWKEGDASETLEPPNTTPGRLADLDLLGGGLPDEMTNSSFRCLVFLLVCALVRNWRTPAIDSLTTPFLKSIGFCMVRPFCVGFPCECLMVCRSTAFALWCAIAAPLLLVQSQVLFWTKWHFRYL